MPTDNGALVQQHLRVMRIIVIALAIGLGSFLGFGLFTHQFAVQPLAKGTSPIAFAAAMLVVPVLVAGWIMPRVLTKGALKKIAEGKELEGANLAGPGDNRVVAQ